MNARFRAAVAEGRTQDAWALLTAENRDRLAHHHITQASANDQAPNVRYGATLRTGSGILQFKRMDGEWQLASRLPTYRQQDTPEAALRTLERAVRVGDWKTVMALAPPERQAGLSVDIIEQRMQDDGFRQKTEVALRALQNAHRATPTIAGQATFIVGSHSATLLRIKTGEERAQWYVEELR